jgi:hypothetical protein
MLPRVAAFPGKRRKQTREAVKLVKLVKAGRDGM